MSENRTSLNGNRASLDELILIQSQTKATLYDLQRNLDQWTPCSDEIQEDRLNEILSRFEQAAKDGADKAMESFPLVSAFWLSLGGLLA